MAERFANIGAAQREGHIFEWMHELSFNMASVAKNDALRLRMTERMGEPHAPADLRILDGNGRVIREIQAKVVARLPARLSRSNGLAAEKYTGMGRLVPTDHLAKSRSLLKRRLKMPEGPLHKNYADVQEHLSDRVTTRDISSRPVSSKELSKAAIDPEAYLAKKIAANQATQLAGAALAASMVSGLISATGTVAVAAVSNGSFRELPWAESAKKASATSVRSGTKALLGQGFSLATQRAVAAGALVVTDTASGSTLPYAMAESTIEIAAIAHGWATGRLSKTSAAGAAAESITRITAIWGCAAMGQVLVPVPVLGSAVGALVGQYGTALLVQGIQLALAARDLSTEFDGAYAELLLQLDELERSAEQELAALRRELDAYGTVFSTRVIPLLAEISTGIGGTDPDRTLEQLASICRTYGGKPVFSTVAEFDVFMADPATTLKLRLNPHNNLDI